MEDSVAAMGNLGVVDPDHAAGLTLRQIVDGAPASSQATMRKVIADEIGRGRIIQTSSGFELNPERFETDQLEALRELRNVVFG
jgi:hypothetical protein